VNHYLPAHRENVMSGGVAREAHMKGLRSCRFALAFYAVAPLLTACGTIPSGPAAPLDARPAPADAVSVQHLRWSATLAVATSRVHHPDYGASWFSPDLAKAPGRLLFISDQSTSDAYIFALPSLTLKATITGLDEPQGECSDPQGNVWIANPGSDRMQQYSRAGKLVNELLDPSGFPAGCAIDAASGELAVTHVLGYSFRGMVLLYRHASGTPATVFCHHMLQYYFADYDRRGTLYVDGESDAKRFELCEKPRGKPFHPISITGGKIHFPGMVQWSVTDDQLVVGDQRCGGTSTSCVYQLAISGRGAKIVGRTTLLTHSGGPACEMVQGVIDTAAGGNMVLPGGALGACGSGGGAVNRWPYPAGGLPTNYFENALDQPVGAAVSDSSHSAFGVDAQGHT
jgi:hypothetical protein